MVPPMAATFSTGATMKNVVGVLHFEAGAYTLLPANSLDEAEFELSNGMTMRAAPVTPATEFSIASLNLAVTPDDDEEDVESAAREGVADGAGHAERARHHWRAAG